jgi:hypothetical protein
LHHLHHCHHKHSSTCSAHNNKVVVATGVLLLLPKCT